MGKRFPEYKTLDLSKVNKDILKDMGRERYLS